MSTRNIMYVDHAGYATLVYGDGHAITTCCLGTDRYVRIDDGQQYPQLCYGGRTRGNTLIYSSDEQLARDCHAKLYKTRHGFTQAVKRITNLEGSEK